MTFRSLALFCRVVDNYGDIGICWRLARQLAAEHGLDVTLYVDDLASFKRICPPVDSAAELQRIDGVTVRHWRGQDGVYAPEQVADIVIEFFAVDIPPGYIDAMARRRPRPVWFNLEGLTAEEWVEGCHCLTSPQRDGLIKHFFFPGFTAKTGGLIVERGLEQQRLQFDPAPFLARLGLSAAEIAATKVSLFCYPHAPVSALLDVWQAGTKPLVCLVPEGVAAEAVRAFTGGAGKAGECVTRGALTLRVLPFVPQADYDKLLWACELNFVRGEDSFVRAQWAGKPFVWHIYPQDENLHHKKLRAFLQRYAGGLPALTEFVLRWNGAPSGDADWSALWAALEAERGVVAERAGAWRQAMFDLGDMAGNLLSFAATLR
ncbi:elongation factor P maturation arginine rhamnosyltransferase EarP [Duganella callida]|uniref:Protein-arginine rhamnosyltransferase n=1 Tax=Duganella callida TaxID=2561932 RepID=A0A4Y9SE80_9BURK|nr:elongation factor P maturation arginine rhamnosyltransferase EarP [Duganella callida]TFW21316.1 elongation factor P maturation arginine rhamnosyltransferase EarP [Duganella callida]